ncbi:hypothetical protein CEXT_783281 [Caerostris extrusa]|uniref:Uncharacterized protein n=1 Tax=Caerostris extrusa TaxID=172846 RepID=A0AAV4XZS7_CAEEX|nr:hypothetical protein CEXT_783281 [Caerostris extrusa]
MYYSTEQRQFFSSHSHNYELFTPALSLSLPFDDAAAYRFALPSRGLLFCKRLQLWLNARKILYFSPTTFFLFPPFYLFAYVSLLFFPMSSLPR